MADKNPRMRIQAIRASETLYKAGDKSFANDYRALTKDPDTNVVIQALLTSSLFKLPDTADLVKAAQAANKSKGVALIGDWLLAPAAGQFRRTPWRAARRPTKKSACNKGTMFSAPCASRVTALTAPARRWKAPPGTMMGPPLAGSPRVQAHRDYVVKVLLKGLQGPLDGKTYREVMVPMGGTDDWIAGIALYVRTSFGNSGGLVTPADVARVRAETAATHDPLDHSGARGLAAAPARFTAVEADGQPWRRDGVRRGHASRVELRRPAGAGHVVGG